MSELTVIIPTLCAIVSTLGLLLYRQHDTRIRFNEGAIRSLEIANTAVDPLSSALNDFRGETREKLEAIRIDGNQKREDLSHDMKNFRAETTTRLEVLRVETNAKLDKLSDQIINLSQNLTHKRTTR